MSDFLPPYSKSVEYTTPTGVKTTLYNIGVLATALGRTTQTVRKWEIAGILPPTPFRINGQRMYSKEHIDSIVKSAEKSNIKQGSSISQTYFSKRLYKDFEKLRIKFFESIEDTKK